MKSEVCQNEARVGQIGSEGVHVEAGAFGYADEGGVPEVVIRPACALDDGGGARGGGVGEGDGGG